MTVSEATTRNPAISIVVPVHNEEDILESTINGIVRELEFRTSDFELIIVENGSTDNSIPISDMLAASDPRIVCLHLPRAGYGDALRKGLRSANGDIIGHFSVDIVDFEFFDKALLKLKSADLIIGSKLIKSNQDRRPIHKRMGSRLFHQLARRVLGIPVTDTHGIKMMNRRVVHSVLDQCRVGGEIFDDEFVLRAVRAGASITEISFHSEEIRPSRTSVLPRALKATRQMIRLRFILWRERFNR